MTLSEHVQTLRAIDANANRATEALRVLEDHARFVRNHRSLAESLKQLRHELVDALRPIAEHQRLAARDTDRDVGTDIQTTTEYTRHNMQDVLVANWKRAQ